MLKRQPLPPGVKLPLRKMMQMQGLTPGQKVCYFLDTPVSTGWKKNNTHGFLRS